MTFSAQPVRLLIPFAAVPVLICFTATALAGPKPENYWQVDDVRAGMKGHGRTVMKGTKVESFEAEVLGVLKNTSPGRDLVICRLSGLNLEKTGVIAGMSGSPIYLDNKLLGAVAYAWPFGKEPIAGVTPFCQMHGFVEAFEQRDLAEQTKPARVGLDRPLTINGQRFDAVTVAQTFDDPEPRAADGLWMVPLRTPLSATGFTPHSLKLLSDRCGKFGLVPMQGGGASAKVAEEEKDTPLEAGGPLAIALISGDFDLSGIGTVTHLEGNRVYGWGHPFMSLGGCDFPLMTGYIHAIYPRQTVSFKMGSPLKTVGVINADVSTCIAGWLGKKPDMLPVRMSVALRDPNPENKILPKTFNVQVARHRSLLANLVFTALTNSVDMEGELPEELTADLMVRIEIEGQAPLVIQDKFSGFSGGRAPSALYSQVGAVVNILTNNPYKPVRITGIACETQICRGRRTADVEAVELDSDTYAPGDTVKAAVFLRPYQGARQRVPVELKLPADLPEGSYIATVCDDLQNARLTLRDNPTLAIPQKLSQLLEALHVQTSAKRTNLVLRLPTGPTGVTVEGQALTQLPGSMVQILGSGKRTGAQTVHSALVSRQPTEWVIQGTEVVRFTVTRHSKVLKTDE
jgi:hypothetical protein